MTYYHSVVLKAKHAPLGKSIVAVENADHPSDAEVLAYARRHFKALDRMFTRGAAAAGAATSDASPAS
jgi:hypothetical protein